jgi:enoyl-CoA hydratase/carnithine racemase
VSDDSDSGRSGSCVRWSRDGKLNRIELSDPARNNALTFAMLSELRTAFAGGAGAAAHLVWAHGRHFCAGGDHDELAALSAAQLRDYVATLHELLAEVASLPGPVIFAVQGGAVGGGLEFALLGDLIVASEESWFQLPQIKLGGRIGTHTYRSLIARSGVGLCRRMALLGDRVDAADALAAGLVDFVVPPGTLHAAAEDIAVRLAGQPTASLRRARASLAELLAVATDLRAEADRRRAGTV